MCVHVLMCACVCVCVCVCREGETGVSNACTMHEMGLLHLL